MSVRKVTLAREDNDGVEYVYPKTTSDIVEYTEEQSVKDKLDSLDGVEREVKEARIAYYDSNQKINLKTRIDEDCNNLDAKIENIINKSLNDFAGILNIAKGGTGKSTAYEALFNLAYRVASENLDLNNLKGNEHIGVWYFGLTRLPDNAPSTTTGYLIVIGESGTLRKQIWFNQGGNSDDNYDIYTRTYLGTSWTNWIKIADANDLINLKQEIEEEITNVKISTDNLKDDFVLPISNGGTDAKIATKALYNLSTHIVYTANLDLNDFIGTNLNSNNPTGDTYMGCYYFGSNYYPVNAPEENVTGYLIVMHGGGSVRKHIWINSGSTNNYYNIYVRTHSGSSWQPWVKIANKTDIESLEQQIENLENNIRKVALVGSDATDQIGWHLVAEGNLSGYNNASIIFAVHDTKSYNSGILVLDLRCANDTITYKNLGWLTRSGFSLDDFGIQTYSSNAWRLFCKVNQQYYRVVFEVIEVSGTSSKDLDYKLYSNQTIYTNTGTPQSSKDLYIPYGRKSNTTAGSYSTAIGINNTASGNYSSSMGSDNTSSGTYSMTFGYNNTAAGYGSSMIGVNNTTTRSYSGTIGYGNTLSGYASNAFGYSNTSSGDYSISFGRENTSSGDYSTASGRENTSSGYASGAIGYKNTSSGEYSISLGRENAPSGYASGAIGYKNTSSGEYSISFGRENTSSGDYSINNGYKNNSKSECNIIFGRENTITDVESDYSCIIGCNNTTTYGEYSYIFGSNNEIIGNEGAYRYNSSDGSYVFGHGNKITESAYSITIGQYNEIANTSYSVAIGFNNDLTKIDGTGYKYAMGEGLCTRAHGSFVCGMYNEGKHTGGLAGISNADTMFTVGGGVSDSDKYDSFRISRNGDVYATTYNTMGADYAEFIEEWYDGNPDNEDRVGYMVTVKNGKLYKANEGDYIIGITSGNPSVIGNADKEYYWRFERDKFNRFILEDAEVEIPKIDTNGDTIMEKVSVKRRKTSSNYNPELQSSYIERKDRPEWEYVGMRGIVPCRDDGTCEEGGFCKCGTNGIATKADTRGFDTYYVLKRIDEETISVEVR